MGDPEPEDLCDSSSRDLGNAVGVVVKDHLHRCREGPSDRRNAGNVKVFRNCIGAHAAGDDEFHARIRSAEHIKRLCSAACRCGEEFQVFKPEFNGILYLRRGGDAGKDVVALLHAVLYKLRVESGADKEFCACRHCRVSLFDRDHSAGSDTDLRAFFGDLSY